MVRLLVAFCSLLMVSYSITTAQAKQDVPVIIGFLEWERLKPRERVIYVNAYLETHAFVFYGLVPDEDVDARRHYSAFIECIEETRDRLPTTDEEVMLGREWSPNAAPGWFWGGSLNQSAASMLFSEIAPMLCKDYLSDKRAEKRVFQVYSVHDWNNFSRDQRRLYVGSYVDTVLSMAESVTRVSGSRDLQSISKFLHSIGIEGVLSEVENVDFHEHHPLPWSIAKGFGYACGEYRNSRD